MRAGSKWQVVALVAIAVGTPVASTLLYLLAPPTGETTNSGELLEPAEVPEELLPGADGRTWHLLVVGGPQCGPACRERLCVANQARQVNLGEIERIGRVWVVTGAGDVPGSIEVEPSCGRDVEAARIEAGEVDALDGVEVVRAGAAGASFLPGPGGGLEPEDYVYFVDPQGNLMMRHGPDVSVKDVAKDLRRLLRLSRRVG